MSDPLDLLVFNNCTMIRSNQGGKKTHQQNYKGKEKNFCALCAQNHKTSGCFRFPTADERKNRLKEMHPELCYNCLTIHDKPCKSFGVQDICTARVGRCCGLFEHRRYLCDTIGMSK